MEQVILDHFCFDSRLIENQNMSRSNDHTGNIISLFGKYPNFIFNKKKLESNNSYYNNNGSVISVYSIFINKAKQGYSVKFYEGRALGIDTYQNGLLFGKRRHWDDSGNKTLIENYEDDILIGESWASLDLKVRGLSQYFKTIHKIGEPSKTEIISRNNINDID